MAKNNTHQTIIKSAETVHIYNNPTINLPTENFRTNDSVIHRYMPADVEEHIWRQTVLENIRSHIKRMHVPVGQIRIHLKRCVGLTCYEDLLEANNIVLWKVHEYVTSMDIPERVEQITAIEKIRKNRAVNFQEFKKIIFARLKIRLVSYDRLVDADLRLLHGFVSSIW